MFAELYKKVSTLFQKYETANSILWCVCWYELEAGHWNLKDKSNPEVSLSLVLDWEELLNKSY